ncbi:amidase signature enzyme [Ramicandelaber brevisporus]|nr:amidase signature enzyme [Ramicandelaber brevisporus]
MSLLWEPFKLLLGTSDQTFTSWQIAFGERFMIKKKTPKIEADFEKMYNSLMALLGDDDNGVLLYPSHSNAARPHGHTVFHIYDFIYTGIFNVTGLPALTVPMGVGKDGLPVGFQLVAKKGNEHVLLKLAEVLEKQFGGWVKPHFVQ